jgi:hypothetical protein
VAPLQSLSPGPWSRRCLMLKKLMLLVILVALGAAVAKKVREA